MGTFVRRVLEQFTARLNSFNTNLNSRENLNAGFRQLRRYSDDVCSDKDCSAITVRYTHFSEFDNIMRLMTDTFFKNDPACVYLGIPDPPHHGLLSHVYDQLKDGMTLVAVDRRNCIVGACINAAVSDWTEDNNRQFAECCVPRPEKDLLIFYDHLRKRPKLFEKYCATKVFSCNFLAVDSQWQKLGVAKTLVKRSWYMAAELGFDIFRFDCTNSYSSKIAEKFGWKCILTLPYNLYVVNNENPFQNIKEPHTEIKIFIDLPKFYKEEDYDEKSKKKKNKKKK